MTFRVSDLVRNAEASAFMALLNGATVQLRSGDQPTALGDPASGILIAEIVLPNPALASVAGGIAVMNEVQNSVALAEGTIGHARCITSGAQVVFDGTVSLEDGGGDIIATVLSVLANDIVGILAFNYSRL